MNGIISTFPNHDLTSNVPSGGIIMWSGTMDTIPSGWVLYNGENGTPDLRNRFIVGAGGSDYNVGDVGGANTIQLTVDQMPSHSHTYSNKSTTTINYDRASGLTATTISSSSSSNTNSTGGGQAHENRPPYYALCFIMKT